MSLGRNWIFTWNNYTPEDETQLERVVLEGTVKYIFYGREVAPSTGTKHLQGYMQFPDTVRFAKVHKMFPKCHIEVARGNFTSNENYCKKDGDYTSLGVPKKGGRSRSEKLTVTEIRDTGSIRKLMDDRDELTISDIKLAREVLSVTRQTRQKPTVVWIYGGSGLGKTRLAYHLAELTYGSENIYKNISSEWFDGYDGHKVIILDDYRFHLKTAVLLALLDRYDLRMPIKGSFVNITAELIVITTIRDPRDYWLTKLDFAEPLKQLTRRLSKLIHIEKELPEDMWNMPFNELEEFLEEFNELADNVSVTAKAGNTKPPYMSDSEGIRRNASLLPSKVVFEEDSSDYEAPIERIRPASLPAKDQRLYSRRKKQRSRPERSSSVDTERVSPISVGDVRQATIRSERESSSG